METKKQSRGPSKSRRSNQGRGPKEAESEDPHGSSLPDDKNISMFPIGLGGDNEEEDDPEVIKKLQVMKREVVTWLALQGKSISHSQECEVRGVMKRGGNMAGSTGKEYIALSGV